MVLSLHTSHSTDISLLSDASTETTLGLSGLGLANTWFIHLSISKLFPWSNPSLSSVLTSLSSMFVKQRATVLGSIFSLAFKGKNATSVPM